MRKFILFLLIAAVVSWAACGPYQRRELGLTRGCNNVVLPANVTCSGTATTICGGKGCSLASCWIGYNGCSGSSDYEGCQYISNCVRCDNACESDSLACVSSGDVWQSDPNSVCGKSCKHNYCTEEWEDYLQQMKESCAANGGTDDLGLLNNQESERCDITGFCDLCTDAKRNAAIESARKTCCELGSGFNENAFNFVCKTTIDGTDKTWDYTYSGCQYNFSVTIGPNGESYADGCAPDGLSSDSESESSSSGSDGSSDSQSGDSSESGGGNSSASEIEEMVGGINDKLLEQLKNDSLQLKADSLQLKEMEDIKQILLDYMNCLQSGECKGNDTTIVNIGGDTIIVNTGGGGGGSVDLSGLTQAVTDGNSINISNGEKLDSIGSILGGLDLDLIEAAIAAGDSGIMAVIGALDSTTAAIGQRLDSNLAVLGSLDSTLSLFGDSAGAVLGGDTSGKGAILESYGDSLENSLWSWPCDTTGGNSCGSAYIGANGLQNAKNSWKNSADALGDSLQHGAVNDSVNSWKNKLVNNGVLSGDGAATCPQVFTRTWNVPLGPTGITYEFGPFSQIVCYDFFGGITFWALARIVLRAMVAITCMWWLYRAVTGTEGAATMKISLYKFLTTYCIIPTTDWAAVAQRALAWLQRLFIIGAIIKLFKLISTPFYLVGIIALLTYFPDQISWIFIKIGEIELKMFAIILSVVMPDIFAKGAGEYSSWSEIWQNGLNQLPTEMVDIMNGLGVAGLMGLVTSTISSIWLIKIYRKVMLRAGLL